MPNELTYTTLCAIFSSDHAEENGNFLMMDVYGLLFRTWYTDASDIVGALARGNVLSTPTARHEKTQHR